MGKGREFTVHRLVKYLVWVKRLVEVWVLMLY